MGINQSCSVQVTTTNTPPVISPGTTTGSEDAAQINGTLSGIDMNPGDSTFFAQFGATPLHGSVIVESSGSFQYYPNPDYCGIDTFEFRASDQFGNNADPVIQTLQIACINDAPIAINDTATGYAGVGFDINPVLNDTDVDSPYVAQTFAISSYTSPINGTLTLSGTTFSYTGNIGYSGADSFQYRIADQSGAISNTGTVNLAITIYNTTPTVTATGFTTNEDIAYSSTLTGVDLE